MSTNTTDDCPEGMPLDEWHFHQRHDKRAQDMRRLLCHGCAKPSVATLSLIVIDGCLSLPTHHCRDNPDVYPSPVEIPFCYLCLQAVKGRLRDTVAYLRRR